jgi:hypothetical protein
MVIVATLMITGCDDTALTVSREAADRQAGQNREMVRLNREVAAGTRLLVEGEARARQQQTQAHQNLHQERQQVADGWNQLEDERQHMAASRRTESMLATMFQGGTIAISAVLALLIAWLTLNGLRGSDDSAQEACQLLAGELLSLETRLLNDASGSPPSLPSPQESDELPGNTHA